MELMSKNVRTAESITDGERSKRQKAVNFACASVDLEGLKPSEADE